MKWIEFKALNNLYINGEIKLNNTLIQSGEINYLINSLQILDRSHDKLFRVRGFTEIYEKEYLEKYNRYETFLLRRGLLKPQTRLDEGDILTLIFIDDHKEELIKNLSSIRTFSSKLFKGQDSKYLENKSGLKAAVCKILSIADFPEKDPKNLQWRLVIDCTKPKIIVLCENIAHLKNPWKARELNMELWYVGGNNIAKIDAIDPAKLRLPVYYSCDWDFDGLSIYSRIKEKLKAKNCKLQLIIPNNYEASLHIHSGHHNSKWNFSKKLSGLKYEDFSDEAINLIERLIKDNKWIEEESFELAKINFAHSSYREL